MAIIKYRTTTPAPGSIIPCHTTALVTGDLCHITSQRSVLAIIKISHQSAKPWLSYHISVTALTPGENIVRSITSRITSQRYRSWLSNHIISQLSLLTHHIVSRHITSARSWLSYHISKLGERSRSELHCLLLHTLHLHPGVDRTAIKPIPITRYSIDDTPIDASG